MLRTVVVASGNVRSRYACPRALTAEQVADARILLAAGQKQSTVATKLRAFRWTLGRVLDNAVPH
jgi:hypothetical protein